jgi:hypothetical protein
MARTPSNSRFYVLLLQIPSPCSRDTGDTRTLGPDHIWMRRRLYNAAWIVYFLVRVRSQKHEWLNTQICFVSYRFFFLSHPPRRLTFLPTSRWIVLSHYLPTSQCPLHWLTEKKKRGGGGEAWMKCENLGQCTSSCKLPACYCYLQKKLDTESHSQGIAPRNNSIICFMFLSSILTAALPLHPLLNILLLLLLLLSYMIYSTSSLTSNKLSTQNVLFFSPACTA